MGGCELKPPYPLEFLEMLAEAVKQCGWYVDHIESARFVEWCFRESGLEPPDLTPYEEEFTNDGNLTLEEQ